MQRPSLDPVALPFEDEPVDPRRRLKRLRERLRFVGRAARSAARVLLSKPWQSRRPACEERGSAVSRLVRGVAYRALFIPIFLALTAAALVYRGTHPIRLASEALPAVPGSFYETLEFTGSDNLPLMAWFVPVVDEKRVIELKDKVYKARYPAAVLVHGYNQTPSQMTPLIQPLHKRGLAVAVVGLRGAGRGRASSQTFGLNEASDVRAVILELRRRPTVDVDRIAIVGLGTGAAAAVLAATQEPAVKAIALIDAFQSADDVIANHIGPTRTGLAWMQEMSKWAFEMAYHVDADELTLAAHRHALSQRGVALLDLGGRGGVGFNDEAIDAVTGFCHAQLARQTVAFTSSR